MSGPHLMKYNGHHQRNSSKGSAKDFSVATPEEFVKSYGGDRVINKVKDWISLLHDVLVVW